jgi:hypothetical protein
MFGLWLQFWSFTNKAIIELMDVQETLANLVTVNLDQNMKNAVHSYLFSSAQLISLNFPFICVRSFLSFRATFCFTNPD